MLDFRLGHGWLRGGPRSNQAQDRVARHREQGDRRRRRARQGAHRARDPDRDPFQGVEGEPLRHQLTEHQREIGDQADDDDDRDRPARRPDHRQRRQRPGDRLRERRATKRASQNADQGDPDLDGGEKAIGCGRQIQSNAGPPAPLVGPRLQPRRAGGDDRQLRGRQHPIDRDQHQQDQETDQNHRCPSSSDTIIVGDHLPHHHSTPRHRSGAAMPARRLTPHPSPAAR